MYARRACLGGLQRGALQDVQQAHGGRQWKADVCSLLNYKLEAQVKIARPNEQFGIQAWWSGDSLHALPRTPGCLFQRTLNKYRRSDFLLRRDWGWCMSSAAFRFPIKLPAVSRWWFGSASYFYVWLFHKVNKVWFPYVRL